MHGALADSWGEPNIPPSQGAPALPAATSTVAAVRPVVHRECARIGDRPRRRLDGRHRRGTGARVACTAPHPDGSPPAFWPESAPPCRRRAPLPPSGSKV